MRQCRRCFEKIKGEFVRANNCDWHPECAHQIIKEYCDANPATIDLITAMSSVEEKNLSSKKK
jgi:hypothetical protein